MRDITKIQSLRLESMVSTDFSDILRPCNRRGGDLCTAPIPLCWPVPEGDPTADDQALQRLEYSTLQQKKSFDVDPSCHFIKVVTNNGEIASFAKWHFYPHGYEFEKHELVDAAEFVPEEVLAPQGPYRIELYRSLKQGMMRRRMDWMSNGPSWVLMAMVTRECYRKQGAASMIIRWGVEHARTDNVPAYLEASAYGKPVLEKCGFKQVGELVPWHLGLRGQEIVFNIAKMAWYPDSYPNVLSPAEDE